MHDQDRTRQLSPDGRRADPRAVDGSAATTVAAPRQGPVDEGDLVLDRYRLEHRIGRGGHGEVWQALDERLERNVAVKVIPRRDALGPRAEREGRVGARLNHPGIVSLYELGSDDEAVYLVSELVRGRTMGELARAGALSDRDVAGIGIALCAALEHAHQHGVIHRDVKPQNVIVVAEPAAGAGFAKLTDFGVAHVRGDETLTRTGDVVGTLAYMAPEQAEGGQVTTAADLYSLALILYEGWTGSGPEGAVAGRLAGRRPEPLRRLRRDLPPSLCAVIDAALDPNPVVRPGLDALDAELHAAAAVLSEAGGLVEPATRRRFGIPAAAAVRPRVPTMPRWLPRVLAALAAGALVVAALELLGAPAFVAPPLLAGAAAAGLVALVPRLGWLIAAIGVVAWLASPMAGLQGIALIVAAAVAPVPVLLLRAGRLWSVPALAPLLGAAGLASAFPLLAALAPTAWRRAGLAIAGLGWLVATELLTGQALLDGPPRDAATAEAWETSAFDAARDAVLPVLTSPVLAPALLWAVVALAVGLFLRRSIAVAGAAVGLGVVALVAAHDWLAGTVARGDGAAGADEVVAGAVLGAAAVLLTVVLQGRRATRMHPPGI